MKKRSRQVTQNLDEGSVDAVEGRGGKARCTVLREECLRVTVIKGRDVNRGNNTWREESQGCA